MILISWNKFRDHGLLFIRVGIGVLFLFHGYPKLFGGPETWHSTGTAMSNLGISFFPAFWGFMAGFTEFSGGLFLIAGMFIRPACMLLAFVMLVAAVKHFTWGDGLLGASHAIEDGIVFIGLLMTGAGRWSVDEWWYRRRKNAGKGSS